MHTSSTQHDLVYVEAICPHIQRTSFTNMSLKGLEEDFVQVSVQEGHKESKEGVQFKNDWFEQGMFC
jgi:glutathionyl-hydroquinone reductase